MHRERRTQEPEKGVQEGKGAQGKGVREKGGHKREKRAHGGKGGTRGKRGHKRERRVREGKECTEKSWHKRERSAQEGKECIQNVSIKIQFKTQMVSSAKYRSWKKQATERACCLDGLGAIA